MKTLVNILIFVCVACCATAQHKKSNPLKMVNIGTNAEKQLASYLVNVGEIDSTLMSKAGIITYELIQKNSRNNYDFVDGIYTFKVNGPHFRPYLFFKEGPSIKIVKNYKLEKLFIDLSDYFKAYKIPLKEQLMYTQALVDVMKSRNDIAW
jgi:hypothetical protein